MSCLSKKGVVLVSGGLDSAVSLAYAKSQDYDIKALTIKYGQRHQREILSAINVCKSLNVSEHRIIELDLRCFGASALTADFEIPKKQIPGEGGIPITYVPARNTIFLSLALAFAESENAHSIFIGVSSVDYSGYPDCRPEFIKSFEYMANLGTRAADNEEKFQIFTPVMKLSKSETVLLGKQLGVDFSLTWSCYDPTEEGKPCRECDSCILRAKGFWDAGLDDPLIKN